MPAIIIYIILAIALLVAYLYHKASALDGTKWKTTGDGTEQYELTFELSGSRSLFSASYDAVLAGGSSISTHEVTLSAVYHPLSSSLDLTGGTAELSGDSLVMTSKQGERLSMTRVE